VPNTIDRDARKNLDQISKVLTQITTGSEFDDDTPKYVPINEFVRRGITEMTAWLLEGNFIVIMFCRVSFRFSRQRTRCGNAIPCSRIPRCNCSAQAHIYIPERNLYHSRPVNATPGPLGSYLLTLSTFVSFFMVVRLLSRMTL
jgi:hypothetical protein